MVHEELQQLCGERRQPGPGVPAGRYCSGTGACINRHVELQSPTVIMQCRFLPANTPLWQVGPRRVQCSADMITAWCQWSAKAEPVYPCS